MTRPPAAPGRSALQLRRTGGSRWWHAGIAAVATGSLVIQLVLVLTGGPDPNTGETVADVGVPTRLVQTLGFFTVQSNILALAVAVTLARDPRRDGRYWRMLRLAALVDITVTGLVFDLVLVRFVDPHGWQLVATVGLHYVVPWASVLGWWWYGPRPRVDRRAAVGAALVPLAWCGWTFAHGAVSGWYPYPFLDVPRVGYPVALGSTALVLALTVAVLLLFRWGDRALRPVPGQDRPTLTA